MSRSGKQQSEVLDRRTVLRGVGVGAVGGALAGCLGNDQDGSGDTPTEDGPSTEETPGTPPQQYQEGGELVGTLVADVSTTDPTLMFGTESIKVSRLMYEGLTFVDFQGKTHNRLATSIERLDDTTVRADLREGVTFHNGKSFVADDVLASFERYEGSPLQGDVFTWFESGDVVDDHTLEINLKQPFSALEVALNDIAILPKTAKTGDLDIESNPVGTGAFQFVEHQKDTLFRVERFEDYWFEGTDQVPGTPPVETVTLRVVPSTSAQISAIKSGDVDVINRIAPNSMGDLESDGDITLHDRRTGAFEMYYFPLAVPPFTQATVRRAVNRLVPRENIIKSVFNGLGEPLYTPVSTFYDYVSDDFHERMGEEYTAYDREKASSLLEEGFSAAGVSKPFETKILVDPQTTNVRTAELVKESLNQTEFFDVTVDSLERGSYLQKTSKKNAHEENYLSVITWSGGWEPALAFLNYLYHGSSASPNCCNRAHYDNERVNEIITGVYNYYDADKRQEIYRELCEIVSKEAPVTFLRSGSALDATGDAVNNWNVYPVDEDEYASVYSPTAGQFAWLDK